jgi:hypothetical protein
MFMYLFRACWFRIISWRYSERNLFLKFNHGIRRPTNAKTHYRNGSF